MKKGKLTTVAPLWGTTYTSYCRYKTRSCFMTILIQTMYIQPKSIETLCTNITRLNQHSALQQHVQDVISKFNEVFTLYSKCHSGYNCSTYVDDTGIKELGKHNMHIILNCQNMDMFHSQNKTSSTSWRATEPPFHMLRFSLKCTF